MVVITSVARDVATGRSQVHVQSLSTFPVISWFTGYLWQIDSRVKGVVCFC